MTELYHPYIKTLQGTLAVHYTLFEALNKRISLIKTNFASKSEFEKNEIEITIIKTTTEIESLKKVIDAREDYFKKYIQQFAIDVEEMEKGYEELLEKSKASKDKVVVQMLESVNWEFVQSNIEAKIKLYQRLKKMVS